MKTIIVTGADEGFSALLMDLLTSIRQHGLSIDADIGVLDLGLSDTSLTQLRTFSAQIVKPDWDLTIAPDLMEREPHQRGKLARPFLRKYFPDYTHYIWLDADTWLQESFPVDWLLAGAGEKGLSAVPQIDRCYVHSGYSQHWRLERLQQYFGRRNASRHTASPYLNAGVFCLTKDAPHWDRWAQHFKAGLKKAPRLVSDQTALNHAVWEDHLSLYPLPALCNWCCHLAAPKVDLQRRKLVEPLLPHAAIGILHLTAQTKDLRFGAAGPGSAGTDSFHFGGIAGFLR